jgi:hypothetical protein
MRFNYRSPGLWAVIQRVYVLPEPLIVPNHRLYAGCRTWVHLQNALSTTGARAMLDDDAQQAQLAEIRLRLK